MLSEDAKKKQYDAQRRIHNETLDRITIYVPKGKKDEYKAYAAEQGMSLNLYITTLIENDMKK